LISTAPAAAWEVSPRHEQTAYDALVSALRAGKAVTALTALAECTSRSTHAPGPKVAGGVRINAWNALGDGQIAFSDFHQSFDEKGEPEQQYLRYTVPSTGNASIRVVRIDAGGTSVDTFDCPVPAGVRFVWQGD
jgi:hypothetical protein